MPSAAPTMWAVTATAPTLAALDTAWSAIRDRHPDVPPAVVTLGASWDRSGRPPAAPADRGHQVSLTGARWTGEGDAALPELVVTAAALEDDAESLLAALLHTAAHAIGDARGVATTSRQGRYHNAKYADLAREVGLAVEQNPTGGWSETTLAVDTAVHYATELRQLRELREQLGDRQEEPRSVSTGRKSWAPVPALCGCSPARRIRVSPTVFERGGIRCDICGKTFTLITAA
jgi:hypothetical protein